jgi:HAD superfamily hydrolase (TIGR01509 family)
VQKAGYDTAMNANAVPWHAIDDVLLDMDGTLLDLAYDNYFWRNMLPERYALARGLMAEAAIAELMPKFESCRGTLAWYCMDHWCRETGLDIVALKRESREQISVLPGIEAFLGALKAQGKRLWLVTNAHPGVLDIKREMTGIDRWFDHVVSSHDLGEPKESADFWPRLHRYQAFDRRRTLFADDSLPVLSAARDYGIAHVVGIGWPDRSQPPAALPGFTTVHALPELLP